MISKLEGNEGDCLEGFDYFRTRHAVHERGTVGFALVHGTSRISLMTEGFFFEQQSLIGGLNSGMEDRRIWTKW